MMTPADRYADLLGTNDDPSLAALVVALDEALSAPAPPDRLREAHQAGLQPRLRLRPTGEARSTLVLSRQAALMAGAGVAGVAWAATLGRPGAALAHRLAGFTAPQTPMTGPRLTAIMRAERARWEALLARVDREHMDEPGVEGTWSVREIVAHITWYERVIVEGARQILRSGVYVPTTLAMLTIDEKNARIAEESRTRPSREVLMEAGQVFGQLLAVIEACPDDLLNDPTRLGLPDDVSPWTLVANNSFLHYEEHARAIEAWLANRQIDPSVREGR